MPDHDLLGITERKRIRTTIRSEDVPHLPEPVG
jgi:hypothetical protein